MIVENLNGLIRLIAEGDNKITNKNRSFYTDFIYLSKNDKVENYEEVPYEVWGLFLENEIPKNKVKELKNEINTLKKEKQKLEDNIYILEDENKTQNEVIENIMINILDLMCPNDINNLK